MSDMTITANIDAKKETAGADRAYRACLGQFATGVTVVTAQSHAGPVGVTANSFASLSLEPPLVTWAIARTSRSFAAFQSAKNFVVNILAADQISVSQAFSSRQTEKFAGISWHASDSGPIIEGAAAILECQVEARHDGGDHLLMVGRVTNFRKNEKSGLLFAQGRYGVSTEHPEIREGSRLRIDKQEPPFLGLLLRAYQHMASLFEEHRRQAGLSLTQSKILFALHTEPHAVGYLAKKLLLGQRECDDAIADLAAQGDVSSDMNDIYSLTERGRARWNALRLTAEQFEKSQLQGFSSGEVVAVRSFLEKLARGSASSSEGTFAPESSQ